MRILCILTFSLIATFPQVRSGCYYNTGYAECVDLDGYRNYQWAQCMSKTQIAAKTKYNCKKNYCYYQCMLDLYGQESGSIYGNCSCSYYSSDDRRAYSLSDWCYDTTERSCSWYSSCLQRQVSCTGSNKNVIGFAKSFCNLINSNNGGFDSRAQAWLTSVSKCFRDKLQTYLRPWYEYPCTGVQQSYISCYGTYSQQLQYILNSNPAQFWYVFWSMKSLFHNTYTPALWGLANLWSSRSNFVVPRNNMQVIKITVKHTKSYSDDNAEFSSSVVDAIASKQGWFNEGMLWYPWSYTFQSAEYSSYDTTYDLDTDSYNIIVLLSNRASYDKSASVNKIANLNISSKITAFAMSVEKGDVFIGVSGFGGCAQVVEVGLCSDMICLAPASLNERPSQQYHYNGCASQDTGHGIDITSTVFGCLGGLFGLVLLVCMYKCCCSNKRSGTKSSSGTVIAPRQQNDRQIATRNVNMQVATINAGYAEETEVYRSNNTMATKKRQVYAGPGGVYERESGGVITSGGAMAYRQETALSESGRFEFTSTMAAMIEH